MGLKVTLEWGAQNVHFTVGLWVLAPLGIFLVLWILRAVFNARFRRLQADGLIPPSGQRTDEDVKKLIRAGYKIEAIKVYREIHRVGLKEAKEAVERMEKI